MEKRYFRYEMNIKVGEFKPAMDVFWIGKDAYKILEEGKGFIHRGYSYITIKDLYNSRNEITL